MLLLFGTGLQKPRFQSSEDIAADLQQLPLLWCLGPTNDHLASRQIKLDIIGMNFEPVLDALGIAAPGIFGVAYRAAFCRLRGRAS